MFLDNCTGVCAKWLGRHGVDVIPVALVRKRPFFLFLFSDLFVSLVWFGLFVGQPEFGLVSAAVPGPVGGFSPLYRRYSKDIV
jgi:hypothetical protein